MSPSWQICFPLLRMQCFDVATRGSLLKLLKHSCLQSCPATTNLKLQPSNLLNFWETEVYRISTVQPWPLQKQCFQTEVTLIMVQLIWYPNSKDRGTSSNCIVNIVLEQEEVVTGATPANPHHGHSSYG
ncbi:uncharacterized protein LOC119897789 isoform X1 [Micropterus salmoides]|uniref:uncharacterized protein LOC119897789 isoform X1 n=1 Tax=Micropterus salmoides TaxID=27706 RepID=UPI0018EB37A7|nr:uncharacterized protein LOC119897789 isoform X1 [Micropterus salmoides]